MSNTTASIGEMMCSPLLNGETVSVSPSDVVQPLVVFDRGRAWWRRVVLRRRASGRGESCIRVVRVVGDAARATMRLRRVSGCIGWLAAGAIVCTLTILLVLLGVGKFGQCGAPPAPSAGAQGPSRYADKDRGYDGDSQTWCEAPVTVLKAVPAREGMMGNEIIRERTNRSSSPP
ncbi:hypothetical protein EDB89DRAFT_1998529 [Lactarius sanguifluus]|nr:hypothetical protein EDB89DRAFT_1998529 [Lactarius sanguifluus]